MTSETPPPGILALPNNQWVLEHDSHLSRWAEAHGNIVSDPHLMKWLRPHLEDVTVIWDVGACIGDHTAFYLLLGKTVVAVEPNPEAFVCLAHNCPSATLLNIAASSGNADLKFTRLENLGASRVHPEGEITVPACALDDLKLPPPGFLKIDAEGHEMFVLTGLKKTISEHRPKVFIEVNKSALEEAGCRPEDIIDFFSKLGYPHHFANRLVYPDTALWGDPQMDILFLP